MAMNCKPVPTLDERINDIRMRTAEIVNNDILPNEGRLWAERREGEAFHERTAILELRAEIKEKVKRAGLWAPHLPKEYGGMGLDFLAHAYMNEVLAYAIGAASLFGVVAPNSGNQSILVKYGTEEQKQNWLLPLIDGDMESGFSMTEPAQRRERPAVHHHRGGRRRRRVRDQRPQVVHVERHRRRLLHRHVPRAGQGRDRPAQRSDGADHRARRHQGREHRPRHRRVGPQGERPLRGEVRGRARPGQQRARPRRRGASGRAGPARCRSHLPLHEQRSDRCGGRST